MSSVNKVKMKLSPTTSILISKAYVIVGAQLDLIKKTFAKFLTILFGNSYKIILKLMFRAI
jgi:hypothetical protein